MRIENKKKKERRKMRRREEARGGQREGGGVGNMERGGSLAELSLTLVGDLGKVRPRHT